MLEHLLKRALPGPDPDAEPPWRITGVTDVNRGRGVFSRVLRLDLTWSNNPAPDLHRPDSVVAKLPTVGANGDAARASGAYRREALAYTRILPHSPIRHPAIHLVAEDETGTTLVMEDLSAQRMVDQMDGLDGDDAHAVVSALRSFHDAWSDPQALSPLPVRRSAPASFAPEALRRGLSAVRERWLDRLDTEIPARFEGLVDNRDAVVDAFVKRSDPTLCHGDPRADNLTFDQTDAAVLFDWQQLAIQLGEADIAWLAATSLTTTNRRNLERDLVATYGGDFDRYRTGLVLPGLAVLLLAQRDAPDERSRRFIATSLQRIGAAIADLEIDALQ